MHALGHLDLDGEVHHGSAAETANANAGNVLGDLGLLEGRGVGASRGGVDLSLERAGAVLVDLVVGQGDFAIVRAGRHARGGALAGGRLDTSLGRALGGLLALSISSATSTAHEAVEETALRGLGGGSTAGAVHKHLNVLGSVDLATLVGAAKSAGLVAARDLAVADDGGVALRSAGRAGTVTGSAVHD